jgi:hypothetical protein
MPPRPLAGLLALTEVRPAVGPVPRCEAIHYENAEYHPGSSRNDPILVNEAAEDVCSAWMHWIGILHRIRCGYEVLGAR